MPRPIHFEIPADDPQRAIRFYEQVFGWRFQAWDGPMPYWLVQTGGDGPGPGIDGGLHARAHPGQGPVNTIDVPSCDDYLDRIGRAGGKTVVPKMALPGVGWLAYCSDPEGNTFGIMQADEGVAAG
ncbi:MAG TPA: VOC family protein [Gemmatimonadales bacterium]